MSSTTKSAVVKKATPIKRVGQPKVPGFLRRYLAGESGRMLLLTALLLASIAAQIVNPLIMRHFIDAARAHSPLFMLTWAALLGSAHETEKSYAKVSSLDVFPISGSSSQNR